MRFIKAAALAVIMVVALAGPSMAGHCHHKPPAPPDDVRYQQVVDEPNCVDHTVITEKQKSHRSYYWNGYKWVAGAWSPWLTYALVERQATGAECPWSLGHIYWQKLNSCNPHRRYVDVTSTKGVSHVRVTHGPKRLRWVIRAKADPFTIVLVGRQGHYETVIHEVVRLKNLGRCHNHPHSS